MEKSGGRVAQEAGGRHRHAGANAIKTLLERWYSCSVWNYVTTMAASAGAHFTICCGTGFPHLNKPDCKHELARLYRVRACSSIESANQAVRTVSAEMFATRRI